MFTTLLAEQPLVLSLMLGVFAGGLLYGWLQSGSRGALAAGSVALALIPVAWVVAANWETDREQIERLLYDVAEAVRDNDHDRALALIGDQRIRRRAEAELRRYEFSDASIRSVRRIELIPGSFPPEADVEMVVKATLSGSGLQGQSMTIPRRIMLRLEKRDASFTPGGAGDSGRWVVIDYQHGPLTGTDAFSTLPSP